MKIIDTKLEDIKIIEPKVFKDHRGFFMESFNHQKFAELGLEFDFLQDNHSLSVDKDVIRGLHYQLNPKAQTKLVRVITGAIYDVAVDIRKDSPTFGNWVGVTLSQENHRMFLVPKGFAHGFCTLTKDTHVQYKVDAYYSAENDKGILWNDPALAINWPACNPILSEKDAKQPLLNKAEINFQYPAKEDVGHEVL
ncbi:dTDP-4-dehydrorhamnose 3,5-epimerase [Virgibacillus profundi]|uniref:dTDP-4-dehydrorhamnose 3,5-epimerase n=1 Tax=Virgibacillus profundi TaxID=2024555 RepID=A0A2A2IJU0_9BACI|nr:dTDP-4-dehydrorhamnose 3,5-epimerase [Virgibacillus profundi]PAV31534.1 dTDP-4-dehydrorhamnose 3,5-epimerase [Virgibacillus profundi]PXY55720.1 dTDP-4-dehydrorhamnose 3,5-epimerase [Virgibacillus profundi]